MTEIRIRKANIEDSATIIQFIKELAIYEKALDQVQATQESIESTIFSEDSNTKALICEYNNEPIGFAVYFYNYSTWLGKKGIYLEDLFVSPNYRNLGAGKALIKYLAKLAYSEGCGRFEWAVLDWNEPAIQFYQSIGAKPQSEWIIYRLAGDDLEKFANE
ncbi:GNAT family N-acetyltransferase [Sessilibacter corallicola]|uniref:GNAT family N-acetyltransferase n=1 Tax=Sessilibacter corallicola TaxID=2904075 RepID=A0ABQ0ABQ7_9GAMM